MSKVALITGIAGHDGAYLSRLLMTKDYRVHGGKRRSSSYITGIEDLYENPKEPDPQLMLHHGNMTDATNRIRLAHEVQPDQIHYSMRMSLELASDEGPQGALSVTSSRQAEGEWTCAFAIARDLALSGKRVLLIDADLRKPSLHRTMNAENRAGLANVLARQKALEDVIQKTGVDNLFLVTSGPLPPNPAQLLTGKSLPAVIARAKELFDVTIIDGPPVLGLADAPRLASEVDGTLFVVEANRAHYGHSKAALKRLTAAKVNILGVILTKFDARKAGYKSEYGYYYYEYKSEHSSLPEPETV